MSNSQRTNLTIKKRRARVEEVEDIEVVDRRGKVKSSLKPVKKGAPLPRENVSGSRKKPRHKSPSPVACGSPNYTRPQRISKVYSF
jgi:hypothetical protein